MKAQKFVRSALTLVLAIAPVLARASAEPGLYQKKYSGEDVHSGDPSDGGVVVSGALFACVGHDNPTLTATDGGTSYQLGAKQSYGYKGFMKLDAGVTYRFAKNFDDKAYLYLTPPGDSARTEVLIGNGVYDEVKYGSYTPEKTGWYGVELWLCNGTGGVGPTKTPFNDELFAGVVWNDSGLETCTADNASQWRLFRNEEGVAPLFYTEAPDSEVVEFASCVIVASDGVLGTVSAEVAYASGKGDLLLLATDGAGVTVTNAVGTAVTPSDGTKECVLTGLDTGASYRIRALGITEFGTVTAEDLGVVYLGEVAIEAAGNADVGMMRPGSFTVSRGTSAAATAFDLTLAYEVSGSAESGVNFKVLPGAVTIPAGESEATISIEPMSDGVADVKTLTLRILDSAAYSIGEAASASIDIVGCASDPRVRYVSTAGSDADGDGLTPQTPFLTIRKAVQTLNDTLFDSDTGTVYVAAGRYAETDECMITNAPIRVVGATEDPDDVVVYRASGSFRLFSLNVADAGLYNLTVSNGAARANYTNGGNVYIGSSGGVVENCKLLNGAVTKYGCSAGNVYALGGVIRRCEIADGKAHDKESAGGNAYLGGTAIMDSCLVRGGYINNSSGGGVEVTGNAVLRNCTVVGNSSVAAAGVHVGSSSVRVENCVIYANSASSPTFASDNVYGPATADTSVFVNCLADGVINDSCFMTGFGFVDADRGDYRLNSASVGVDAGVAVTGGAATDLDGRARVIGDAIDIGCYECDQTAPGANFTLDVSAGIEPLAVEFTARSAGFSGPVTYTWDFGDGSDPVETQNPTVPHEFTESGVRTVTLTATDGTKTFVYHETGAVNVISSVIYVKQGNDGAAAPYATEETAAKTLEDALKIAMSGNVIKVFPGTYQSTGTITLKDDIKVIGVEGDPTNVVIKAKGRGFMIDHPDVLLANVTISGGACGSAAGGGVYIDANGGIVSNCLITGCNADNYYANAAGAYLKAGFLTHCEITKCNLTRGSQKYTTDRGIAVVLEKDAVMDNCLIHDMNHDFTLMGNMVYTKGTVRNCTVVDTQVRLDQYSVRADGGSVINTVVAGVFATNFVEGVCVTNAVAVYGGARFANCASDVEITDGADCLFGPAGEMFSDYAAGDYRPATGGLLIGRGMRGLDYPATDLGGGPRVAGSRVDIGCYEGKTIGLLIILR